MFDTLVAEKMKPNLSITAHININILHFPKPFTSGASNKSPHFAVVFSYVIRLAALYLFAIHGYSTLLYFQWGPTRMVLAADSLAAQGRRGNFEGYFDICKIYQEGDVFIAMAGAKDAGGMDFISIARKASGVSGAIELKMERFSRDFKPVREGYWDEIRTTPGMSRLTSGSITIIMASRREHTIAMKYYNMPKNGLLTEEPPTEVWGKGFNRSQKSESKISGTFDDAVQRVNSDSIIKTLHGTPAIVRLFQFQFDAEAEHGRRGELRRVGPPISILRIEGGKAAWEPGYQGKCPNIRP